MVIDVLDLLLCDRYIIVIVLCVHHSLVVVDQSAENLLKFSFGLWVSLLVNLLKAIEQIDQVFFGDGLAKLTNNDWVVLVKFVDLVFKLFYRLLSLLHGSIYEDGFEILGAMTLFFCDFIFYDLIKIFVINAFVLVHFRSFESCLTLFVICVNKDQAERDKSLASGVAMKTHERGLVIQTY